MANPVKKLSIFTGRMIPDHIRESYPGFQQLVTAFFEFIEQTDGPYDIISNLLFNRDIDNTIDRFLETHRKTFAPNLPENAKIDLSLLIKNIRDIYRNKANEQSYDSLMRALYGDKAQIHYPRDEVLIASDGKWYRPIIAVVENTNGTPVTYQWLYDNFFSKEVIGLTSGDTGFVDFITEENDPAVSALDSNPGKVLALELEDSFGKWECGETLRVKTVTGTGAEVRIITPLSEVVVDPITGLEVTNYIGWPSVMVDQGRYINSDGFLSSNMKLQDNYYYHTQSYQIRSTVAPSQYTKTFKKLLHPAGMIGFNVLDYLDGKLFSMASYPDYMNQWSYWTIAWMEGILVNLVPQTTENLILNSERFHLWTLGQTTATPNTDLGLDGTLTADTITDSNSTTYGTCFQTVAVPADTKLRTFTLFIKADQDETRFPEVKIDYGPSARPRFSIQINTKTGETFNRLNQGTTQKGFNVSRHGDYWKVDISLANDGVATTCVVGFWPSATATLGAVEITAKGSVIVWGASFVEGRAAEVYVPTTSSPVKIFHTLDELGVYTAPNAYIGATPHTYAFLETNRGLDPWINIYDVGYFDQIPIQDFTTKANEPFPYGYPSVLTLLTSVVPTTYDTGGYGLGTYQ